MTTEYRARNTSPTDKMPRIDDREVLSGAAMTRVERVEAGAGTINFKIKGGNPMEIGDKGYLIEVGMKGIREDKWLKPPLYQLIEIQKGFNVTHFVFRSVEGGYKRTMMDKDFSLGERAFCDTPEPISRSGQPRLRARIADISKHSHFNKFDHRGYRV